MSIKLAIKNAGATKRQHTLQYIPGAKPIISRISSQNRWVPVNKIIFYMLTVISEVILILYIGKLILKHLTFVI